MPEHYDLEVTCPNCGEEWLFNPPVNNPQYTEICDNCYATITVPVDKT